MKTEDLEPIDDRMLDMFVSQKYHWKSLSPTKQRSMAAELMKHRFLEKQYLNFINQVLADKDGFRKYRELVSGNK